MQKPRPLKDLTKMPTVNTSQKNSWMTAAIFEDWQFYVFINNVTKTSGTYVLHREGYFIARKRFKHKQISKFNSDNELFKVLSLPPNVTSVQQPMDQGIICSFKLLYKAQFLNHILRKEIKAQEKLVKTIKEYNIRDCIFNVGYSWDSIKNKGLRNSWK